MDLFLGAKKLYLKINEIFWKLNYAKKISKYEVFTF